MVSISTSIENNKFQIYHVVTPQSANSNVQLLVDSGASTHIFSQPELFVKFNTDFIPRSTFLELADGTKINTVENKGVAVIPVFDVNNQQQFLKFEDALFVPSFRRNIISLNQAIKCKFRFNFNTLGSETMQCPEGNIFRVMTHGHLYYLNNVKCNTVVSRTLQDWHQRLAHANHADIMKLPLVVTNMQIKKSPKLTDCETCIKAKLTQNISKVPDSRGNAPFQQVHVDLNGPIIEENTTNIKYIFGVVCDYSQFLAVYLMQAKGDSPIALRKYLSDIAPYGTVTCLRSDGGGEFISQAFNNILIENRIRHEHSAPYSPHQLGHIERQWRTVFQCSRALLFDSGIPAFLWPNAVKHTAYVRNRTYQKRINCTPLEKATNKQPDLSKLPIFGAKCFMYEQDKSKLDSRATVGCFIGFDEQSPAKLVYEPQTGTIRKVRDVKILDTLFYIPNVSDNPGLTNVTPDSSERGDMRPNPLFRYKANNRGSLDQPVAHENYSENITDHNSQELSVNNSPNLPNNNNPYNLRKKLMINYDETLQDICLAREASMDNLFQNYVYKHRTSQSDLLPGKTYQNIINSVEHTVADVHYQTCLNINHTVIQVPNTYKQAMLSKEKDHWVTAMNEEMSSLHDNSTWTLVKRPKDKQIIGGRWVYSIKTDPSNNLRYKARYVAKGYTQQKGINFAETYAPTARMVSIRIMINIAVQEGLITHHCDVNNAYLNSEVDFEDMFMTQPEGYALNNDYVCHLHKAIYGLKQAANCWHQTLLDFMKSQGLTQSVMDTCVFVRRTGSSTLIVLIWVDDLIISASSMQVMQTFKRNFAKSFRTKDLGLLTWFLGIEFKVKLNMISLNQSLYITSILHRFNEFDCHPRSLPCDPSVYDLLALKSAELDQPTRYRELVGSLIYLMTGTRPDIAFIVTLLSRFMNKPTVMQMTIARGVLKYLKGTRDFDLKFVKSQNPIQIYGYSDSDWASDCSDFMSISGYAFKCNPNSALISWRSGKQTLVAASSCEAEYIALHAATCEALFLRQIYAEFTMATPQTIMILADNQGAIALAKHATFHKKSKHIHIKFHATRRYVENRYVILSYIPSKDNLADMATKPIKGPNIKSFAAIRGVAPRIIIDIE